jgi:hypothetical protein
VQDVLAGRHALGSVQREEGLLRPLPLSDALEAVAARVPACLHAQLRVALCHGL